MSVALQQIDIAQNEVGSTYGALLRSSLTPRARPTPAKKRPNPALTEEPEATFAPELPAEQAMKRPRLSPVLRPVPSFKAVDEEEQSQSTQQASGNVSLQNAHSNAAINKVTMVQGVGVKAIDNGFELMFRPGVKPTPHQLNHVAAHILSQIEPNPGPDNQVILQISGQYANEMKQALNDANQDRLNPMNLSVMGPEDLAKQQQQQNVVPLRTVPIPAPNSEDGDEDENENNKRRRHP